MCREQLSDPRITYPEREIKGRRSEPGPEAAGNRIGSYIVRLLFI